MTANRRVSFAPEATLHTWDVIEYMRDATNSSASSERTRRASSTGRPSFAGTPARQEWEPESDPPSTPPEQADDNNDLPAEPEHQRDVHQKKRRRSSVVPPMNFNNPDDEFSSSPTSGSSSVGEASSDVEQDDEVDNGEFDDDDGESTAMSLDMGDNTMQSEETESTDSSLTNRLRQASQIAGTRGIAYDEYGDEVENNYDDGDEDDDQDEYGDMTMEMATQDLTKSYKPWPKQNYGPPPMAKNIIALQDQENVNPFSPAFRQAYSYRKPQGVPSTVGEETEYSSGDVSMDMTRSVGGILQSSHAALRMSQENDQEEEEEDDSNDMSMDVTRAVGGILQAQQDQQQQNQSYSADQDDAEDDDDVSMDMTMDMTRAVGGILPRQQPAEDSEVVGDETMDFTQAIGKIVQPSASRAAPPRSALKRRLSTTEDGSPHTSQLSSSQGPQRRTAAQVTAKRRRSSQARVSLGDATMDFTVGVGGININPSPVKQDRRSSLRRRRSSAMSSVMDEQTMEFTMAVGGIRQTASSAAANPRIEEERSEDENEELSMEFTAVIGGITPRDVTMNTDRPTTPKDELSPSRTEVPTTPNHDGHFREVGDHSANKLLTPMFEQHSAGSAMKDSAGSRRSSARKSAGSARKSPALLRKSPIRVHSSPVKTLGTPNENSAPLQQSSALAHSEVAPAIKSPPSARKSRQPLAPKSVSKKAPHNDVSTPQLADDSIQSFSPVHVQDITAAPVEEIVYPTLPEPEAMATPVMDTPESSLVPQTHQTHVVAESGSPLPISGDGIQDIDMDAANPPSPSLDKQMRSSPMKVSVTPRQRSTPERTATPQQPQFSPLRQNSTPQQAFISDARSATPQQALVIEEHARAITDFSDSLKMIATPRKDTGTTPLKRLRGMTPMKSPAKKAVTPRKTITPKAKTPHNAARSNAAEQAGQQLARELFAATKTGQQIPKVKLNEFLDMAGIKFMELTMPTKRRFTTAPTPGKASRSQDDDDDDGDANTVELESAVVAGACTVPMLDLFQHACRELKRYISEGKSFVKTLESEVHAEPPPLISAYVSASPQRRSQLDAHMRDIKTSARLRSKEIWYEWRTKLLESLEEGLKGIQRNLENDASLLGNQEQLLDTLLPDLLVRHEQLGNEATKLEKAAAATSQEEKEDLDAFRERLVDVTAQIAERKHTLASLQQEVQEQDGFVEAYTEAKTECLAQIQEAERVKKSCRGWSIDEVTALKSKPSPALLHPHLRHATNTHSTASVVNLESETGWTITSASSSTLTMTYRSTLALFFDASAFLTPHRTSPTKMENQPISLTYIGASNPNSTNNDIIPPSSLPTETRFFLQLMRAQLQCLEQKSTSVKHLLKFVSGGWDIAASVTEAVRRLRIEFPLSVAILSDERLGVAVDMLLPKVQTKVRVWFEISAAIVATGAEGDGGFEVGTNVEVKGTVVYGQAYNEKSMEAFLGRQCGAFGQGWEDAVRELRVRLVATGRKE